MYIVAFTVAAVVAITLALMWYGYVSSARTRRELDTVLRALNQHQQNMSDHLVDLAKQNVIYKHRAEQKAKQEAKARQEGRDPS